MDRKVLYRTSLAALGVVSMLTAAPPASAADMPESWHSGVAQRAVPVEDVCAELSGMWLFKRIAWLRDHPECAPRHTADPWSSPESKPAGTARPAKSVDAADPPAPVAPPLLPCGCVIPSPDVIDRLPPIPDFN